MRVVLEGGPLDGIILVVSSTTDTSRPLLLPTNREALFGEAPPTAPHFSEYRLAPSDFGDTDVWKYIGDGMDVPVEVVYDEPGQRALD